MTGADYIVVRTLLPFAVSLAVLLGPAVSASPRVYYQRGENELYTFENNSWRKIKIPYDDAQFTQRAAGQLQVGEGTEDAAGAVDVIEHTLDLKTETLSTFSDKTRLNRVMSDGRVLRSQFIGNGDVVYEYKDGRQTRVANAYRPGFKEYNYLPDGSYFVKFEPAELNQDGPLEIHYSSGKSSPAKLVSRDWLFYPRFVNNGSHIVWLTRTHITEAGATEWQIESVDVKTGQIRQLGARIALDEMSNIAYGLVSTMEAQPWVCVDPRGPAKEIYDVRTGGKIGEIREGENWMTISAFAELGGYALSTHLLLENQQEGVLRAYSLPDLKIVFQTNIPGGAQDDLWATAGLFLGEDAASPTTVPVLTDRPVRPPPPGKLRPKP